MKPDIDNPGQVEATQKPAAVEVQPLATPEQALDKVGEKPTVSAAGVVATDSAQPVMPVATPPPVVPAAAGAQAVVPASAKDQFESQLSQLPAEDSEVIEKVWVDKADEIVEKTKDDPYLEDEAQHSLSRAYLKKRFNLDVN